MKEVLVKRDSLQDVFKKQKDIHIWTEIHLKSGHSLRGRILEYDRRGRIFFETLDPREQMVIYEDAIEYIVDKTLPLYRCYSDDEDTDADQGDDDGDQ